MYRKSDRNCVGEYTLYNNVLEITLLLLHDHQQHQLHHQQLLVPQEGVSGLNVAVTGRKQTLGKNYTATFRTCNYSNKIQVHR